MTTKTVYRIEHQSEKIGPFRYRHDDYTYSDIHSTILHEIGRNIKDWYTDGICDKAIINISNYVAGCLDLNFLIDLFADVIDDLMDNFGFVISEYIVPVENIIEGNSGKQVAFLLV